MVRLRVPPLRDRREDIPALAAHFLAHAAATLGAAPKRLDTGATARLAAHAWPGNVRELENLIKRAAIMADGSLLTAADLGLAPPHTEPPPFNLRLVREDAERAAVRRALAHSDNNVAQAAELLGVRVAHQS